MKQQSPSKKKFYNQIFQYKRTLIGDGWTIKKWVIKYPQVLLNITKEKPRPQEPIEIDADILFDGNNFNPIRKETKIGKAENYSKLIV